MNRRLLLVICLLLAACTPAAPTPTPTPAAPTRTPLPTSTPTPTRPTPTASRTPIPTNPPPTATYTPAGPTPTLPARYRLGCLPPGSLRQAAEVLAVPDAATLRVRFEDGVENEVRLLGVEPPPPGTAAGFQAAAFTRQLVAGQPVTLVQDITYADPDGRLLRYVLSGDTFVNAAILENGYARHVPVSPDLSCAPLFRGAAQAAFQNFRGLWSLNLAVSLTVTATLLAPANLPSANSGQLIVPTPTRGSPTPRCDPAYPTICLPPPPPYLNCGDIIYRNFVVLWPDPHDLDGRNHNGIGCETTPAP